MSISTRNGSSNIIILYCGFSGRLEIIRRPISSRFARLSRSVKLVEVVSNIPYAWFLLPFSLFSLYSKLTIYTLTRIFNCSLAPFSMSLVLLWSIQWYKCQVSVKTINYIASNTKLKTLYISSLYMVWDNWCMKNCITIITNNLMMIIFYDNVAWISGKRLMGPFLDNWSHTLAILT